MQEHREELRRFLRVAQNKQAQLVIFPELAGVMVAPPRLRGLRAALLKRADQGRRKQASLWQRATATLANQAAQWLHADFRAGLRALLDVAAAELWSDYANLYSELAREFNTTLVAPSAYLPDPRDQVIRNLAAVFDADGSFLGAQAKVLLHPEDEDIAQAGAVWEPIQTKVGAVGIMLGGDVLYPEVGRALAYQGAEILVTAAACPVPVLYQKVRGGILARMQDNQLFAAASFLVGHNELGRQRRDPFVGKAAIFAPQELTPRYNGVLVEMGNTRSEGVLSAEWNFVALKRLWETSDTPVRQKIPAAQVGQLLGRLYERLKSLPRTLDAAFFSETVESSEPDGEAATGKADSLVSLDELPAVSIVTRRWSPAPMPSTVMEAPLDLSELPEQLARDYQEFYPTAGLSTAAERPLKAADDETDEMDALPQHGENRP
jgi:predicted amidohydrolase